LDADQTTVNRLLAPSVVVQDVVFSPLSTGLVVKVKVTGTVDHAAGICGRNETHPFHRDGERTVPNQVSGTIGGGSFEIDGIVVQAGVNVLSVRAWDGPGETRVEVVLEAAEESGAYGDAEETPYAILSVSAGGAAGEGGGGALAGGESFMTFGALAASFKLTTLTVQTKGDETNVFVATDLRFTVAASACNAELVSATLDLGTGGNLAIFNNGNANPHAKKSDTVTKGEYAENGTTYPFEGFWWDVDAASKGHWEVTATAVLVVNTDPPTAIEATSNALPGNNDAVKSMSFEVVNSPADGWLLTGSSGTYQVLSAKGGPGSVRVKATATTEMALLTEQVSWFRNGQYAGQGRVLQWSLETPDAAYDVIAFGEAENATKGTGPAGPEANKKPDPTAGESAVTIKVDAGYGTVLGWRLRDPVAPSNHFTFPVGEQAKATLVLQDFTSAAPLPQVQGWYLLPEAIPAGLSPLDISEVESGLNHSGSTVVTLNGISPGTVNVLVAILPPGAPLSTLPYCVMIGAEATTVPGAAPEIRFLDHRNIAIDPKGDQILHVSNWVTNYWDPPAAGRRDPEHQDEDPDNFRIMVEDPAEEWTGTELDNDRLDAILEVVNGEKHKYTLKRVHPAGAPRQGVFYGPFLRLVSDKEDNEQTVTIDGKRVDATIQVKLGDTVKISYTSPRGQSATAQIKVGPVVRVKVKVVVFKDARGVFPDIQEKVTNHLEAAEERMAQVGVTLVAQVLWDDQLPRGPGPTAASLEKGFDSGAGPIDPARHLYLTADEESAFLSLRQDQDKDSVYVFYVNDLYLVSREPSPPGKEKPRNLAGSQSYPASRNKSGPRKASNNVVINVSNCHTMSLAHELMHILLNSGGHPKDVNCHLMGDSDEPRADDKVVTGPKRIGPYDGDTGALKQYTPDEETMMRVIAVMLPAFGWWR